MPYVYYTEDGTQQFLCSVLVNHFWKLHRYDYEKNQLIPLQINDLTLHLNECNPNVFKENNELCLAYTRNPMCKFIASIRQYRSIELGKYSEVKKQFSNFQTMFESDFGIITTNYKITASFAGIIRIYNKHTNQLKIMLRLNEKLTLARIVSLFDDQNKLIISWIDQKVPYRNAGSLLYDLNTNIEQSFKLIDSQFEPYKAYLDVKTNNLFYASRNSKRKLFQDRHIYMTDKWTFENTNLINILK